MGVAWSDLHLGKSMVAAGPEEMEGAQAGGCCTARGQRSWQLPLWRL